jgi:AcrR family transcriptional regulator
MEDIAAEGNITKVTLYSYFQSKDNLIMAVTYEALLHLEKAYNQTISESSHLNGLELSMRIMETFIQFCETNYFYSEALLEYFAMVRSTSLMTDEEKLSEATKGSDYFSKLKELHNYPFKITAKAIEKGIQDGSIDADIDPMFATVNGWIVIIGYVKLLAASGGSAMPIFNVNLEDTKHFNLKTLKSILQGKINYG